MTTPPENCRINYIEFNVHDMDQAKAFYGQAFGWTFTDYGPAYTEFSDGAMKGGFTSLAPPSPAGGPLVILTRSLAGQRHCSRRQHQPRDLCFSGRAALSLQGCGRV